MDKDDATRLALHKLQMQAEDLMPKKGKDGEPQRVKTGIAGLDDALGGGFLKKSLVVIGGETGNGKTVLSMQYILNGMLKYGELGLFISIDEERGPMRENMRSLGWDLERLEKGRKLIFLDYPLHEVEQFYAQENTILELIKSTGIKRVVIDSAAPLAIAYQNPEERREGLMNLVAKIRKWDCTTLITCESEKGSLEQAPSTKFGIEWVADAFIYLHKFYLKGERRRALEVVKVRGSRHAHKLMPMIISEGGITVYPKKKMEI